jgi:SAM-dependent methyltransferase
MQPEPDADRPQSGWPVVKQVLAGLASRLPGGRAALAARGTSMNVSARYCYGVWLRHLMALHAAGWREPANAVAELGPGDCLGIGLAALVGGCERYVAVDAVAHAQRAPDAVMLEDLIELYQRREPPAVGVSFPVDVLPPMRIAAALRPERLAGLRRLVASPGSDVPDAPSLQYIAPWSPSALPSRSIDFVLSQAVMEHVDALPECYAAQARWLRPGGAVSHAIDFDCHWTARRWNGHWAQPPWLWRVMRGRRAYLINRVPCEGHLQAIAAAGLQVLAVQRQQRDDGIDRSQLGAEFRGIDDEDLRTASVHIVARRN